MTSTTTTTTATTTTKSQTGLPRKVCFVTIGATASFASLIRHVVSTTFCMALQLLEYTDLIIQYGADGQPLYEAMLRKVQDTDCSSYPGLKFSGFALDHRGLAPYMKLAKTGGDDGVEGVVVSHAGIPPSTTTNTTIIISIFIFFFLSFLFFFFSFFFFLFFFVVVLVFALPKIVFWIGII